ncbi:acyl-CoA thioesterase [Fusarium falciforme]|nr:acyl-CoA thioesterase [Fusarium falciforme]
MPPMEDRPTLLRPPEPDASKSLIENVLDVTELKVLGQDVFTNTRPQWHPPGARGIYGGAVIAQCLAAAQKTVPETFLVHSCHCYFLLAGSSETPILYHVERVRDGRSYATRTVQARQKGACIFTTTISFVREATSDKKRSEVRHAASLPEGCLHRRTTGMVSPSGLVRVRSRATGSRFSGPAIQRPNRRTAKADSGCGRGKRSLHLVDTKRI